MKIQNETNDTRYTMHDLYTSLIDETVVIWLHGGAHPLSGKLVSFNGGILHLDSKPGWLNTYIPVDKVIAICSEK